MALTDLIKPGEEVLAELPDHLKFKVQSATNLELWIDSQIQRSQALVEELQMIQSRMTSEMKTYAEACGNIGKEVSGYMRESYNVKEDCVILRKDTDGKVVIVRRSKKEVEAEIGKQLLDMFMNLSRLMGDKK